MAAPQIGPGKAERFETHSRDVGRMRVSNDPADAYAFRTPSLRNVLHTGPWGHAGGHSDLATFLRDHADPARALTAWDPAQATLPPLETPKPDFAVASSPVELDEIRAAIRVTPRALSEREVGALISFLDSLTDRKAIDGRLGIPESVPSGLAVDR
jgi:cytochrome c peroxidase